MRWNLCPHCGRPGLFPNVRAAQVPKEKQALEKRYQASLADATARGAEKVAQDFDTATQVSKAVIARPLRDADRLTSSDKELYSTYYKLLESGLRLPYEDEWETLRRFADTALFTGYEAEIRFAALCLDDMGLAEFGDCYLIVREDMIAHRATVFEENSALFLRGRHERVPEGYRAVWAERSKLCSAKCGGDLKPGTPASELATVLMRQKTATEESRFVEVHIYGPLSIRSFEKVVLKKNAKASKKSFELQLRDQLKKVGVPLEVK